jgi:hypothetical protein
MRIASIPDSAERASSFHFQTMAGRDTAERKKKPRPDVTVRGRGCEASALLSFRGRTPYREGNRSGYSRHMGQSIIGGARTGFSI